MVCGGGAAEPLHEAVGRDVTLAAVDDLALRIDNHVGGDGGDFVHVSKVDTGRAFVGDISFDEDELFIEELLDFLEREDASFHFLAGGAPACGEVDEDGLACLSCAGGGVVPERVAMQLPGRGEACVLRALECGDDDRRCKCDADERQPQPVARKPEAQR